MNYSFVQLPYFLDFFPRVLLISVPARTQVQFKGGVNITRQHMPSRVLARVRSVRHKVLIVASNERSCLSRDLCWASAAAPTRLYNTLDRPPCRSVSTFAPGAPPTSCEFHYCAGTIRGRG